MKIASQPFSGCLVFHIATLLIQIVLRCTVTVLYHKNVYKARSYHNTSTKKALRNIELHLNARYLLTNKKEALYTSLYIKPSSIAQQQLPNYRLCLLAEEQVQLVLRKLDVLNVEPIMENTAMVFQTDITTLHRGMKSTKI